MPIQINCSDIATTTAVSLDAGNLSVEFCHEDMQTTYDTMFTLATANFPGGAFVVGDGTPDSGDQNKLWVKQDGSSCEPLGWYYYDDTWKAVRVPDDALMDQSGLTAGTHQGLTVSSKGIVTAAVGSGLMSVGQGTTTASDTALSTTFTATGLSISLTPSSTSSKILITVSQQRSIQRASGDGGGSYSGKYQLSRAGSPIWGPVTQVARTENNFNDKDSADIVFNYLDSPSTTSATLYSVEHAIGSEAESGNSTTAHGTIIAMEIL